MSLVQHGVVSDKLVDTVLWGEEIFKVCDLVLFIGTTFDPSFDPVVEDRIGDIILTSIPVHGRRVEVVVEVDESPFFLYLFLFF